MTPPDAWTPEDLASAVMLDLGTVPVQPAACQLVEHLTAVLESGENRQRGRSLDAHRAFQRAVAGVVGGSLRAWRKGRAVFHVQTPNAFSDGPVSYRQFIATVDGLVAHGLLQVHRAIRYELADFGDGFVVYRGRAARMRPTARLLELAAAHAVTMETVKDAFGVEFSSTPPAIPECPVTQRPLKEPRRRDQISQRGADLPSVKGDRVFESLCEQVREQNAFAARHTVLGCPPPRWRRIYGPDWMLDGRWYALGANHYQGLSEDTRAGITINGEPTAEVDVSGSHLSIMHGLLGRELPEGDLYHIDGLPRSVVKKWVTATLGKGSPLGPKWPTGAVEEQPELAAFSASEVGAAVVARYDFLAAPAEAVAGHSKLGELAHLGRPTRLLALRLMGIEAAALTAAMGYLRFRDVLALPVHDSLIVPKSEVSRTQETLRLAFEARAKVTVRTKVSSPSH